MSGLSAGRRAAAKEAIASELRGMSWLADKDAEWIGWFLTVERPHSTLMTLIESWLADEEVSA